MLIVDFFQQSTINSQQSNSHGKHGEHRGQAVCLRGRRARRRRAGGDRAAPGHQPAAPRADGGAVGAAAGADRRAATTTPAAPEADLTIAMRERDKDSGAALETKSSAADATLAQPPVAAATPAPAPLAAVAPPPSPAARQSDVFAKG